MKIKKQILFLGIAVLLPTIEIDARGVGGYFGAGALGAVGGYTAGRLHQRSKDKKRYQEQSYRNQSARRRGYQAQPQRHRETNVPDCTQQTQNLQEQLDTERQKNIVLERRIQELERQP